MLAIGIVPRRPLVELGDCLEDLMALALRKATHGDDTSMESAASRAELVIEFWDTDGLLVVGHSFLQDETRRRGRVSGSRAEGAWGLGVLFRVCSEKCQCLVC